MKAMLAPLLPVLALGLVASVAHASAADVCVPEADVAPQWWNPALSAQKKESRWDGAITLSQTQAPHAAAVRMIWKPAQQTVYVEISVEGDSSLDLADDLVLVALGDETGTLPELFLRFAPLHGCSDVADCTGAGAELDAAAVEYSEASFGGTSITWSPLSTTNPSADFFVEHPWVAVDQVGSTYDWRLSFALQVPVDVSGEIWPNLRIYGNAVMYEPGPTSGTLFEFPLLCTSSSLTSNDCLIFSGSDAEVPYDLPIGNMKRSWPVLESGACAELVIVPPA